MIDGGPRIVIFGPRRRGMLSACVSAMRYPPPAITVFVVSALVVSATQTADMAGQRTQQLPNAADTLPAATVGNANVEVTIVDRGGAPLGGVTVNLTGVVNDSAVSDDFGLVGFYALPTGRYDVVASMKGLAPSVPRVIDLPVSGMASVAVTLKPYAPSTMMTNACGGFDASSIRTLSTVAHFVLHVKIAEQHTIETPQPEGSVGGDLSTVNQVQVLQSFKRNEHAPVAGSIVDIGQGGGRIDRGDFIDVHKFNNLAPLNIGDEYVLFVYDNAGDYTILGAEEGVFRVRNGRVEPLGRGGAASAWKGRPAERLFEALRTLP
jgi:Carboxypeptidase regulatory-like domain